MCHQKWKCTLLIPMHFANTTPRENSFKSARSNPIFSAYRMSHAEKTVAHHIFLGFRESYPKISNPKAKKETIRMVPITPSLSKTPRFHFYGNSARASQKSFPFYPQKKSLRHFFILFPREGIKIVKHLGRLDDQATYSTLMNSCSFREVFNHMVKS